MLAVVRRVLFALMLLTVLSCSTDEPITLRLDPSWSAADVASIEQAVNDWNAVTLPSSQLAITSGGAIYIEHADPMIRLLAQGLTREQIFQLEGLPELAANPSIGLGGWCYARERLVQINPSPLPGSTYAIALHELGHVLGLRHTRDDVGVMSIIAPPPAALVDFRLTPSDLAECRRAGRCPGATGGVSVTSAW